eukprot:1601122-Amphidinium_carterae.1
MELGSAAHADWRLGVTRPKTLEGSVGQSSASAGLPACNHSYARGIEGMEEAQLKPGSGNTPKTCMQSSTFVRFKCNSVRFDDVKSCPVNSHTSSTISTYNEFRIHLAGTVVSVQAVHKPVALDSLLQRIHFVPCLGSSGTGRSCKGRAYHARSNQDRVSTYIPGWEWSAHMIQTTKAKVESLLQLFKLERPFPNSLRAFMLSEPRHAHHRFAHMHAVSQQEFVGVINLRVCDKDWR